MLHGFSWAATAALRVIALPDGVRPRAIKAACLCMGNDELHEADAFFERRVPERRASVRACAIWRTDTPR